jgi:hypothetical protein
MRKVLFKKWIPREWEEVKKGFKATKEGTGCFTDMIHKGLFHQWALGYEEWDSGPVNYTYAIIELSDGTIEEVLPVNLKFVD